MPLPVPVPVPVPLSSIFPRYHMARLLCSVPLVAEGSWISEAGPDPIRSSMIFLHDLDGLFHRVRKQSFGVLPREIRRPSRRWGRLSRSRHHGTKMEDERRWRQYMASWCRTSLSASTSDWAWGVSHSKTRGGGGGSAPLLEGWVGLLCVDRLFV